MTNSTHNNPQPVSAASAGSIASPWLRGPSPLVWTKQSPRFGNGVIWIAATPFYSYYIREHVDGVCWHYSSEGFVTVASLVEAQERCQEDYMKRLTVIFGD